MNVFFWQKGKWVRDRLPVGAFVPQVVGQLGRSVYRKKGSMYGEKCTAEQKTRSNMTPILGLNDDNTPILNKTGD